MNTINTFSLNGSVPEDPLCNAVNYFASGAQSMGLFMSGAGLFKLGTLTWLTGQFVNVIDYTFCRQQSLADMWLSQYFSVVADITQIAISLLQQTLLSGVEKTVRSQYPDLTKQQFILSELNEELKNRKTSLKSLVKNSLRIGGTINQQKNLNQQKANTESLIKELTQQIAQCNNKIDGYNAAIQQYSRTAENFITALATGAHAAVAFARFKVSANEKETHYKMQHETHALFAQKLGHSIETPTNAQKALDGLTARLEAEIDRVITSLERLSNIFKKNLEDTNPFQQLPYNHQDRIFEDGTILFGEEILPALSTLTGIPIYEIREGAQNLKLVDLLKTETRFSSFLNLLVYIKQGGQLPSQIALGGFAASNASVNLRSELLKMIDDVNTFMRLFSTYLQELNHKNLIKAQELRIRAKLAIHLWTISIYIFRQKLAAFNKL